VGGPLECAQVEPCGGDVVGTWHLAAACINTAALTATIAAACPGASISKASVTVAGTVTYNADLTYAASGVNETISITEIVPLSCTGEATCAAFAQMIMAGATNPLTVSCTGSSTCTCMVAGTNPVMAESGTYSTAGTTLSSTASGTGVQSDDLYCVLGTNLHVVSIDTTMNMGPMGQATIESDVVAQRQ